MIDRGAGLPFQTPRSARFRRTDIENATLAGGWPPSHPAGWAVLLAAGLAIAPPSARGATPDPRAAAPAVVTTSTAAVSAAFAHPEPSPEDRRLIEADRALAAGDADRAVALLQESAGLLNDYRALLLGRALVALDRAKSYAVLDEIKAPKDRCARSLQEHPIAAEAIRLKAKVAGEYQEPGAAAEMLAGLAPQGDTLLQAAELYRVAEDEVHARLMEQRLLVEAPDSLEARALAKQLKKDGVKARLGTIEKRIERIQRLLDRQQNADARSEALQLLDELPKTSDARCELSYLSGKASRKLRQYQGAVRALAEARERCVADQKEDLALRSALLEVQVRAIRGESVQAEKVARWIKKTHPQHSFLDDALLFLANLYEDQGKSAEAKKIYRQIADDMPDSDQAPEAAWRLAYMAIRADEAPEATKRLGFIIDQKAVHSVERARARYWLARSLEKSEPAKARALYERVVLAPTFYAWLSLDHLRRDKPEWAKLLEAKLLALRDNERPEARVEPTPDTIVKTTGWERARRLRAVGANAYAEAELALLACPESTDEEILTIALALDAIGAHPRAQLLLRSRARTMLAGPLASENLHIWRAAYSRPFFDTVQKVARLEKIEPMLFLALVREESTFDPQVISWAGAIGLSQLMPGTAVQAHAALGLGRLDVDRLTDPELNLRLGARVLRDGLKEFRSREPLALVAYNGGPGAALKLIDKEKGKPFERWVEEISVKETRGYVKRVLETWGIYRYLYDRERPFIALPKAIGGAE